MYSRRNVNLKSWNFRIYLRCISPHHKHSIRHCWAFFSSCLVFARKQPLSIRQRPRTRHLFPHKSSLISERNPNLLQALPTSSAWVVNNKNTVEQEQKRIGRKIVEYYQHAEKKSEGKTIYKNESLLTVASVNVEIMNENENEQLFSSCAGWKIAL